MIPPGGDGPEAAAPGEGSAEVAAVGGGGAEVVAAGGGDAETIPPGGGGAEGILGGGSVTVVGIGARAGVRTTAVRALLDRVVAEHGLDPSALVYATVEARADELRVALGGAWVVAWPAGDLAAVPVPHPSERVAAAAGTPSVAEAAALLTAHRFAGPATDLIPGGGAASTASGDAGRARPAAELVVPKTVGDGVTVAVARARR